MANSLLWDTYNVFGGGVNNTELLLALNRVRELGRSYGS
jgi:hypothetical protein